MKRQKTDIASVEATKVLLIDDEADTLLPSLAQNLEPLGFAFSKETNARNWSTAIDDAQPDIVLLDLHFPQDADRRDGRTTGGELLPRIRRRFETLPVIVFTTRLDDADFPLETFDEVPHGRFAKSKLRGSDWALALAEAMRDAIDTARFSALPDEGKLGFLVGQTTEMGIVAGLVRTAARNRLNVLVYGETGTGKQLVAEAIHRLSGRTGRFEQVNCSGIDENTLEDKLFGHERGAFTGAQGVAPGLFELSDGGTLFLDEIQYMPMALQHKLMLVIEQGKVRRMGASIDKTVDVRLIAATNHNLDDLVTDRRLREDLAHRLTVIVISIPALRQRMVDLGDLFSLFVGRANSQLNRHILTTLRPETQKKLEAHSWPGNIRELETTLLRAATTTTSNVLLPDDIVISSVGRQPSALTATSSSETAAMPAVIGSKTPAEQLTDQLEILPREAGARYRFLLAQGKELRAAILTELVCRFRRRSGKKVTHKVLAAELDPDGNYDKVRQLVCQSVTLTELECNQ